MPCRARRRSAMTWNGSGPVEREVGGEGFGQIVKFGEMVAVVLEDRADALDGVVPGDAIRPVGARVGDEARLTGLLGRGIGTVEALNGGHQGRRVFRGILEFGARHRRLAKQGIGQHLRKLVDGGVGEVLHEFAGIDAVDVGEPRQDRHGDRPLIALHQVEVARRNREFIGHARLGQAAFPAQAFEPGAGEDFADRRGRRESHCRLFTE